MTEGAALCQAVTQHRASARRRNFLLRRLAVCVSC